jgi:hypothetical protein
MGYLDFLTVKVDQGVQVQAINWDGTTLTAYAQNVGPSSVNIANVYIDDVLDLDAEIYVTGDYATQNWTLPSGETREIVSTGLYNGEGNRVTVKLTTAEGNIFMLTTSIDGGADLTSIIQYANSSSSNVDGSADVGTENNFVNAQDYGPDSDYLTIQEENLGGGSGGYPRIRSKTWSRETGDRTSHDVSLPSNILAGDTLLAVFVCDDNEAVTWPNEGVDWKVIYEYYRGSSGPTMSIAWKKAIGNEDGQTIRVRTGSNEESVHIVYAIQNAEDPTILPPQASSHARGTSTRPNPGSLSPSGGSNTYLWFAFYGCDDDEMATSYPSTYSNNRETHESSGSGGTCAIGAASRSYTSSNDNPSSFRITGGNEEWEAATVAIYPTTVPDDYELDFEYQWTSAEYDETIEEVCIYVETASQNGENLVAYEWDGSNWQSLGILSSDGWNKFSVSHLTGSTYTINIRDSDKSNDAGQSTWTIDCIITECS